MKISAVICEYNPFHNGHAYQIKKMRENGVSHVVCIMSGNFTQRGEAALFPKAIRARAALLGGADLIVELPLAYALSTADSFAFGGVDLADAMGCVNSLSFGAECPDISLLCETANLLKSEDFKETVLKHLSEGITFAAARQRAVLDMGCEKHSELLSHPNNILAISYLSHLSGRDILPEVIVRKGASHHSKSAEDGTASAGYIRNHCFDEEIEELVPKSAFSLYKEAFSKGHYFRPNECADKMILSKLRSMTPLDLKLLPDLSEGIEHRLYKAVRQAITLEELYTLIKSKRYTMARVRRLVMAAYLGLSAGEAYTAVRHCNIIGMNERGAEVLSLINKNGKLIASHSPKRLKELLPECSDKIDRDCMSTDLYNLMLKSPQPCSGHSGERIVKI